MSELKPGHHINVLRNSVQSRGMKNCAYYKINNNVLKQDSLTYDPGILIKFQSTFNIEDIVNILNKCLLLTKYIYVRESEH